METTLTFLIINTNFQPLYEVGLKRAIKMFMQGRVVEALPNVKKTIIKCYNQIIELPHILKLTTFLRRKYKGKVLCSKRKIYLRDKYICGYCGKQLTTQNCTIDHIIPKSKGGESSWENMVTSCKDCNTRKGNSLPSEIKMYVKSRVYEPTVNEYIQILNNNKIKKLHTLFEELLLPN